MSARGWREILVCATVLAVTLRPFPALANIGLPMVAVFLPPAWFALIPIIIIESAYGVWRFRMAASPTYAAVATANCISTLIGLPITWVVLALGQLLLFGWLPEFSMAHRFVGRDRTERALAGRHGDGAHGSIRFEAISLSSDQVGQELSGGSGFGEPLRATGIQQCLLSVWCPDAGGTVGSVCTPCHKQLPRLCHACPMPAGWMGAAKRAGGLECIFRFLLACARRYVNKQGHRGIHHGFANHSDAPSGHVSPVLLFDVA
jgi:hypothetical protein